MGWSDANGLGLSLGERGSGLFGLSHGVVRNGLVCQTGRVERAQPDLECHCVMSWIGKKWHVVASRVDMNGLVS